MVTSETIAVGILCAATTLSEQPVIRYNMI